MANFSRCRDYNRKQRFYAILRNAKDDTGQGSLLTLWLLEILIDHCDDKGQCFPSDDYLAKELDTSRQSIIKARKILARLGAFYNFDNDASTYHYQLTGVILDFVEQKTISYVPLELQEEQATLLALDLRGYAVKNFDTYPVKKDDTKKVIPPLEENNCLEFQKDEKNKTLIDPYSKERVLVASSVECYEKSHPHLKWFKVSDGRLIDSKPYQAIETYYTLPRNATLIRAYHLNEKWVLVDAHTFLAHMTANKQGELVPYGNSAPYMPLLNLWAAANLQDHLPRLSVPALYKAWLEVTGGQIDRIKFFPVKPSKVLNLLNPKPKEEKSNE